MKAKMKKDLRTWWRRKYFNNNFCSHQYFPGMNYLKKISDKYSKMFNLEKTGLNNRHCMLEQLWAVSERLVDL